VPGVQVKSAASFEISPDSGRVVYMAETVVCDGGGADEVHELFSVPVTGLGSAAIEISGPMVTGGAVYAFVTRFKISPDGR
jgi:hypothetical protein